MHRALLLVIGMIMLMGCTTVAGTGQKGYVTGNGQLTVIDPADRGDPIALSGTDLDDVPVDVAELRGKPVVINVWWSQCPPCRTEMPLLVAAATRLRGRAHFLGIDIRDPSPDPGRSFVDAFDVPYPSLYDPDGTSLLAFSGALGPRTIPSTVVLDADGKVAATIIGPIPTSRTLIDLVDEVADSGAAGE